MARRSSNPTPPLSPDQPHATRRVGGSRHEATERVRLARDGFETSGWTLNVSRGGARLVLEGSIEPGEKYALFVGDSEVPRDVRVVWVQDEADGQIVGVQFLDAAADGSVHAPPSMPHNGRTKSP